MKTTAILAIVAIGAVIAVAGLAVASGPAAMILGAQDGNDSGRGMMRQDGSCGGGCGSGLQNQYRQDGESCPGACSFMYNWNYSYSRCMEDGATNQLSCCSHAGPQYQNASSICPGACQMANDYDYDYSWDWNYSRSGPCAS